MFRKIVMITSITLATLCQTTAAIADAFPVDKDGYKQLRIAPGIARADDYLELLRPFMDDFPDLEEGRARFQLTMNEIEGGISFDIINSGFADDSVAGEQFRGVIIKSGNRWELIELHQRWICARGKRSDAGICT